MPRLHRRHGHFRLFFFNDTATTEIYTLSLHDALPICRRNFLQLHKNIDAEELTLIAEKHCGRALFFCDRSEEHTSELQSRSDLVCRLLLEKKRIVPAINDYARELDSSDNSTAPAA